MIVQLIDAKLSSAIDKIDVHDMISSNKMYTPFTIVLAKTTDAGVGVNFPYSLAELERISVLVLGNTVICLL